MLLPCPTLKLAIAALLDLLHNERTIDPVDLLVMSDTDLYRVISAELLVSLEESLKPLLLCETREGSEYDCLTAFVMPMRETPVTVRLLALAKAFRSLDPHGVSLWVIQGPVGD